MTETKDEPVFVVKLSGILHPEEIEQYARKLESVLPGRVLVTDGRVEDVYKLNDWMQPKNATITVRHERREFDGMDIDGIMPKWRSVYEYEQVHAKVWPVSMGANELLVEYEDGSLHVVKLYDIKMER